MEEFKGLIEFMEKFDSDDTCRKYLRQLLYPENPSCKKCGYRRTIYVEVLTFRGFQCHICQHRQALVKHTMFSSSKIPLRKWFIAIYVFTVHDNGITAKKMAELLGIYDCSAWHLLHRIRKSLHTQNINKKLCGIVEADETYIGADRKKGNKRGRGSRDKIVFGTVERKGRVYAKVVENCKAKTLQPIIHKKVRKTSKFITDHWNGYKNLQGYRHIRVKHKEGMGFTATIERFWGSVKATIRTHRKVSKKHLQKYIDAVVFFYNTRLNSISEKFNAILTKCFEVTTLRNLIDAPYILD